MIFSKIHLSRALHCVILLSLANMSLYVQDREAALQNRMITFAIVNGDYTNLDGFLEAARPLFVQKQQPILNAHRFIKAYAIFIGEFKREKPDENGIMQSIYRTIHIYTKTKKLNLEVNLSEWFNETVISTIKVRVEDSKISESGWTLSSLIELEIHNNKYDPIRGASYIETPDFIRKKKRL